MAMNLTELQGLRDTLVAAIAKGVKSVSYDTRVYTYQDVTQMRAALQTLDGEIAAAQALSARRSPFVYVSTERD
jgi:hypothetical protein